MSKKPRKSINLICLRVAVSQDLLKLLREASEKETRTLSAMARLIIERALQPNQGE